MELGSAAIAVLDKPTNQEPPQEKPPLSSGEDEFTNFQEGLKFPPGNESLQGFFDYLARTRRLEVDTPRVTLLQGIADKMTAGTDASARVVIMNKGREVEAFVATDGTIFISQSLINTLDSLDEVAGILAHEVGHRLNKTHEKNRGWGNQPEFAVGWIHEIAADNLAPHLLEKAGFNSFGLSKAITKISPNSRGREHQTGEARATQVTVQHGGIHFATSAQELTPMPENLKTTAVTPTNQDIVGDILKEHNLEAWGKIISLLHPQDLGTAYSSLTQNKFTGGSAVEQIQRDMLTKVIDLFTGRLAKQGMSKEFINLYFLASQGKRQLCDFSMFKTPEDLESAIDQLDSFGEMGAFKKTQETLFSKSILSRHFNYLESILENLAGHISDVSKVADKSKIPVTEDSLITVLQKIHNLNLVKEFLNSRNEASSMTAVVISYIKSVYKGQERGSIDQEAVHQFFLKIKAAGIPLTSEDISDDKFDWDHSACNKVVAAFDLVFPKAPETVSLEAIRERFLQELTEAKDESERVVALTEFLGTARSLMDKDKMDDGQRKAFLEKLDQHLERVAPVNLTKSLNLGLGQLGESQVREIEQKIYDLNIKTIAALGIFQEDGSEFYDYIKHLITKSGIDHSKLSWQGLANVYRNLMKAPSDKHNLTSFDCSSDSFYSRHHHFIYLNKPTNVTNIEELLNLEPLQELIKRQPAISFATLKEFNSYLKNEFSAKLIFEHIDQIFDDSLSALILGENLRRNAGRIFAAGIKETEYDDLHEFISSTIPNGPEKGRLLRELKHHFLHSQAITLQQKTDYIIRNFDDIGPEGMIEVGEQITTLAEYREFHSKLWEKIESYLNGSVRVTQLATTDSISSQFVGRFNSLFLTARTDAESAKKASSQMAEMWYRSYQYNPGVDYDPTFKKFTLESIQRQTFQTLGDSIDKLQNLTSLQRFAIALKAMVDKNGAMTSENSRRLLGETITSALKIKSPFINSAIRIICAKAPADFASLPAAQILAPLLFKNLSIEKIEEDFFAGVENPALKVEIKRLMKSPTRDVTLFGAKYLKQPDSYAARAVSESDSCYRAIGDYLIRMFPDRPPEPVDDIKSELDPSYEALISGVENSGPLGTRGLQLTRQLLEFSPPVDQRLARSLDRMHGLNKLLFWENILKLIDDAKTGRLNGGTDQAQLVDFLERRLISLDEYLGGGSLYTTYAARILDERGVPTEGVVKMLRPNPELFIKATYQTTSEVFSEIEKSGSEADQRYARMGQIFIDLAQQWCLKDIMDPSFAEDDDNFRNIINSYNTKAGRKVFYAPSRLMTSYHIKSETKADGPTLNVLLEDRSVKPEVKRKAVGLVIDLFRHQLQESVRSDQGKDNYHLVHSDPHMGNYIVDANGNGLRIGVVDRSMYLKLTPAQAHTFDKLLSSGDYQGFLSSFIDQVLDHNKIINKKVRKTTKNNIRSLVVREYLAQRFKGLRKFSLEMDNFSLLRKMLEGFDRAKLDIPLEMRLMIKSIESLREQQKRYK